VKRQIEAAISKALDKALSRHIHRPLWPPPHVLRRGISYPLAGWCWLSPSS
jgi:hypothetical protein